MDESIDDRRHTAPERNRYFHGKLMTARDMAAEQRYHRDRFTRHARGVTGYGVVEGLQGTVEDVDGGLAITLSPGYAVDCAGRPVVVPTETTVEIPNGDVPSGDRLELHLIYDECVTETVPIPGSEDACERECAYNRVVETFELELDPYDPETGPVKPVPPVDLPRSSAGGSSVDAAIVEELRQEFEELLQGDVEGLNGEELAEEAMTDVTDDEAVEDEMADDTPEESINAMRTTSAAEALSSKQLFEAIDLQSADVDLEQRQSRFMMQSSPDPTPEADPLLEPELALVEERREAALEADDTRRAERLHQLRHDIEAGRTTLATMTADDRSEETKDGEDDDRDDSDLGRIARSWDAVEGRPVGCGTDASEAIPLGVFDRPNDGTVEIDPASRPRVYTNDMLYSGLAHHVGDFGNPHDVVATLQGLTDGVELGSEDGSVEFDVDAETGTIDLSVDAVENGGDVEQVDPDKSLRVHAMTAAADAFADAADDFTTDAAGELASVLREAIEEDEIAREPDGYLEFVDGTDGSNVLDLHEMVGDELGDHVGGTDRYGRAVGALADAVVDEDARRTAISQLLVAAAVQRLTGQTVDLTRFFPNPDPARPLTIDGVIFDAPEGFQFLHEEWYEILEDAEEEAEEDAEEMIDLVYDHGRIDLAGSLEKRTDLPTITASLKEEDEEGRTDGGEDEEMAEPRIQKQTLEVDTQKLQPREELRTAFFGPAVIDNPKIIDDVELIPDLQPIQRTPRAVLDFSELYIDVPGTTSYVEGDVSVSKYPIEVLALDRGGNLVDDDEAEAGDQRFTVEGDDIDRLTLSVKQGTGELTELRIR